MNIKNNFKTLILLLIMACNPAIHAKESTETDGLYKQQKILAIDLNGDGIHLIELKKSGVYFDFKQSDFKIHTSWVSKYDGLLVIDRNGDGLINNINELFEISDLYRFELLKTLDSNQDNLIDEKDPQFKKLLIWQDSNSDGISQSGELYSLRKHDIAAIHLKKNISIKKKSNEKNIGEHYFIKKNNQVVNLSYVNLMFAPTFTKSINNIKADEDIKKAGNIKGYGLIPDLHIAMSLDSELKQLVLDRVKNLDINNAQQIFDTILIKWADVETIQITDIDPSHNLNADHNDMVYFKNANVKLSLQQLGIIKKYSNINPLNLGDGEWYENGKILTTGQLYQLSWNRLYRNLFLKFIISNGLLKNAIDGLEYNPSTDVIRVGFDINEDSIKLYSTVFDVVELNQNNIERINRSLLSALVLLEIRPGTKKSFVEALKFFVETNNSELVSSLMNNNLFQLFALENEQLKRKSNFTQTETEQQSCSNFNCLGLSKQTKLILDKIKSCQLIGRNEINKVNNDFNKVKFKPLKQLKTFITDEFSKLNETRSSGRIYDSKETRLNLYGVGQDRNNNFTYSYRFRCTNPQSEKLDWYFDLFVHNDKIFHFKLRFYDEKKVKVKKYDQSKDKRPTAAFFRKNRENSNQKIKKYKEMYINKPISQVLREANRSDFYLGSKTPTQAIIKRQKNVQKKSGQKSYTSTETLSLKLLIKNSIITDVKLLKSSVKLHVNQ